jgi:hypothetical protein
MLLKHAIIMAQLRGYYVTKNFATIMATFRFNITKLFIRILNYVVSRTGKKTIAVSQESDPFKGVRMMEQTLPIESIELKCSLIMDRC